MVFNHLLGRRGYTPMRVFSSLCHISRTIIKDGVASQEAVEEQENHASQEEELEVYSSFFYQHLEEIQETWTTIDEE